MTAARLVAGAGAAMLLLGTCGRPAAADEEGCGGTFAATARAARDGWHMMARVSGRPPSEAIKRAADSLARLGEPSASGCPVIDHMVGRLSMLRGHKDEAAGQFVVGLAAAMAPEDVLALLELRGNSWATRSPYIRGLAELLPVSGWRRQVDARDSVLRGQLKRLKPRTVVPRTDRQTMLSVATCLAKAGLPDLAWRAYAETAYAALSPPWVGQKSGDTWLSPAAAECWGKAALCAREASRRELAWDYLMKAAVFGDDALFELSLGTAKEWTAQPEPPAPAPVDPAVKREVLTRAVRLYAEMNAHPRAFTLIDENRDAFEDPDGLRREIEEQWLAVVEDVSRDAEKVTLYGLQVHPEGDPLKVRIPWALSDEALSHVREQLASLHAGTAEAVPPAAPPAPEE